MSLVKTIAHSVIGVGKEGYKKGKRISKLAQLTITLKIEQDRQKSYYKEIGEHVHNDHINEPASSPKIKNLREKIVMQERKIKKLVEEINASKRLNSCTYCGYVSKEEYIYCPKCSRARSRG